MSNVKKKRDEKEKPMRIGKKFHKAIVRIKGSRLMKGPEFDCNFKQITNLIVEHKLWREIEESVIEADPKEVKDYG